MDIDSSKKKSKGTKSYKNNCDDFKKPKTAKQLISESKNERRNRLNQIRRNKINEYLLKKRGIIDSDGNTSVEVSKNKSMSISGLTKLIDMNSYSVPPKICALVALNEEANLDCFLLQVDSVINNNITPNENNKIKYQLNPNVVSYYIPGKIYKGKERLTFIKTSRDAYSVLDACKVADIVLFVSSCKKVEYDKIAINPFEHSYCIDDFGYQILSMIRAQGLTDHLSFIQDLALVPEKKRNDIKKLYERFHISEVNPNKTYTFYNSNDVNLLIQHDVDQVKAIIRQCCSLTPYTTNLDLRKHRSYMMIEDLKKGPDGTAEVYGYLRGNTVIIGKYIHITGFGDYKVADLDDAEDPLPIRRGEKKDMEVDDKTKINHQDNIPKEEKEDEIESKTGNNQPQLIGENTKKQEDPAEDEDIDFDINIKDEDDISFDESHDAEDEAEKQKISNKHRMKTALKYRTKEEMEFQDEVDTPIDISARERFHRYRGLESMKTGNWNPLENLPKEYGSIFSFENIKNAFAQAVKKAHLDGIKKNGCYVKIVIKGFDFEELKYIRTDVPLVLSTLLEHERKLCVMNYKVETVFEQEDAIIQNLSKKVLESHCGFRRYLIRPIFSTALNTTTDKVKFQKYLDKDKFYICTVYAQLTYPNSPVLLTTRKNGVCSLVAKGVTAESDARKVILKKIILTGYPVKIKKKNAVVRYMFFNPNDVSYFKPIQLVTKNGLRGNIKESVGTHGYMKCYFNGFPKSNDTICLNLYKRVFPKWFTESWKYHILNGNKEGYLNYFVAQEGEDEVMKEN